MRPFLLAVLLAVAPARAIAQEEDAADEDRSTAFESVEGPSTETVPGGRFLVIAYAIIWLAILGFVTIQWRRIVRLEAEVDRLTKAIEERSGGGGSPPRE